MSIEADIKEASLAEIQKGLASISSGYLALRIRELEAKFVEREKDLQKQINALEKRLDRASEAFKELKESTSAKS